MRVNVCLLSDTSVHTQCFAEIADSVAWALQELGHEVKRASSPDQVADDGMQGGNASVSIVFGARPEHIAFPRWPKRTIFYNGEQVDPTSMFGSMIPIYRRFAVWDYSASNAARYEKLGLPAPAVVRPGYAPVLEGRIPASDKTHDVVFFGSLNDRRRKLIAALEAERITVLQVPFGLYGAERDAVIAKARLCINVHYYQGDAIFEAIRCSHLAINGVLVASELSADSENEIWGINSTSYDLLVSMVKALLASPEDYEKSIEHQRAKVREVSLVDDVRAALEWFEGRNDGQQEHPVGVLSDDGKQGDSEQQHRVPELTLNMIVKDEKDVIERCLNSVKPYIKRWCILDTGSTDGTQDIIRRCMEGIEGELFEREWKNYDGSRTEAIELARQVSGGKGWLLLLDSDEVLKVTGDVVVDEGYDCQNGWISRCDGCVRWTRPMFVRANKPWYYMMPRHEGLYCKEIGLTSPKVLDNVWILSYPDGARAKESAHARFLRDARVLEEWSVHNPGNSRCQYYIAQSYRDASTGVVPFDRNAQQKAIMHYLRRADMAGYDAETFSAMFQAAKLQIQNGYPWDRVLQLLLRAWNFRPSRAEPLHLIAMHYRFEKQWTLAELFARKAASLPLNPDVFPDFEPDIYKWQAKDELATALTYLNGHAEARDLFREIIDLAPPFDRPRIQENLDMCIRTVGPG